MNTNRLFRTSLTVLSITAAFLVATVWAGETALKVGKKGDIHFSEPIAAGDVVLKPGHYQMQHQVKDGEHYIDFLELKHLPQYKEHYTDLGVLGTAHPGGAKCRIETLPKKAERTAVYVDTSDGKRRITRIEIAGENVAHVF